MEKGRKQGRVGSAVSEPVYDSSYKLDEKESKIVDYLKKNPGCTKEDVVENVKINSRMTIRGVIARLLDRGVIITTHKDRSNQCHQFEIN